MSNGQRIGPPEIRRVELAVGQCEELSILPAVAASFLGGLGRMELTPSSLAELIESDPALTVLILRLCQNKKIIIKEPDYWILQVLESLALREIRDAVLSAKIFGGLSEDASTNFRKELTLHSLAVACCAEKLAQLASPSLDGETAHLAGLLHDTGKFLLDEVMPKSFDTLLEQARSRKTSFAEVERENLGLDHTILGKRFAQRMQLPAGIILGIWLHHSQAGAISESMPQARIAGVVELADCIVRRAGIGESGSYDEPVIAEDLEASLGLVDEQIRKVEQQLPDIVRQKSEVAGLTLLKPAWAYCDALRATTSQLAGENAKLFDESSRLQRSSAHFDFIRELLPKINPNLPAISLAEEFAACWQRFYQTGPVCVYLTGEVESKIAEAAVIEDQTKTKTVVLEVPDDADLIPQPMREKFVVLDANDGVNWLIEQIDVDFDITKTKIAPLQANGGTVGIIVFEMRHPAQGDISGRFEGAARFGGTVLDMLKSIESQQLYAERFVQLLAARPSFAEATEGRGRKAEDGESGSPAANPPTTAFEGRQVSRHSGTGKTDAEALAEIAAGAAHEMNNPLSVIRGRAQLLAKTETDQDKKRILEQIQQNAGELAAIIDDLMSYANPEKPRPTDTAAKQIIDEAADLTIMKKKIDRLDAEIDIPANIPNVFVDSAQIASAISNIICNGLESYETGTPDYDIRGRAGPIAIRALADKNSGKVNIEVADSGRGMDEQTLANATKPFFSAKPAGRKRGMGLAHAQRLIEINKGTLEITSQPGKGTTVTIVLPCK
jgi:putative nucleotidyltransferase with HDIG domain